MRRRRILAVVVATATLAGLAVAGPLTPAAPAQAAFATEFDPGNIISDQVFYASGAMSAAQVQAFLDAKIPLVPMAGPVVPPQADTTMPGLPLPQPIQRDPRTGQPIGDPLLRTTTVGCTRAEPVVAQPLVNIGPYLDTGRQHVDSSCTDSSAGTSS